MTTGEHHESETVRRYREALESAELQKELWNQSAEDSKKDIDKTAAEGSYEAASLREALARLSNPASDQEFYEALEIADLAWNACAAELNVDIAETTAMKEKLTPQEYEHKLGGIVARFDILKSSQKAMLLHRELYKAYTGGNPAPPNARPPTNDILGCGIMIIAAAIVIAAVIIALH